MPINQKDSNDLSFSMDVTNYKIEQLHSLFPEVLSEGQIDFDRLKAILGDHIVHANERYELSWAGKAEARREIQKKTTSTLLPDEANSIHFGETENLYIEGENLEVLRTLQKAYFSKVKMIYIDPPYNTGNDSFVYPDDYSERLAEYRARTGETDEAGFVNKQDVWKKNTRENGQFHSVWLSMMYPRLFLARNLLRDDGVIFVSIDDNEAANLRMLMDEVFGEENFLSCISVVSNPRGRQSDTHFAYVNDYLLVYAKQLDECLIYGLPLSEKQKEDYKLEDEIGEQYRLLGLRQRGAASRQEDRPDMYFPIYVDKQTNEVSLAPTDNCAIVFPKKSDGTNGRWMWGKEKCENDKDRLVAKLIRRRNEYDIFVKDYLNRESSERTRKPKTIWNEKFCNNQIGTQEVKQLLQGNFMSYPKSKELLINICRLITASTNSDIVLDFFSGSGTTAHAIIDLNEEDGGNRKFLCIQMPEKLEENSDAYKAGFRTIADIGRTRIQKVIANIQEKRDGELSIESKPKLGFNVFKLAPSNFKEWRSDIENEYELLSQLELHLASEKPEAQANAMVYELLLKSALPLTTPLSKHFIDGQTVFIARPTGGNPLLMFFEQLSEPVITFIHSLNDADKPCRVLCLNRVFPDSQTQTNFSLGLKDAGIELTVL